MSVSRVPCLVSFAILTITACATPGNRQRCRVSGVMDELTRLSLVADSTGASIAQSVDTMAESPRQLLRDVVDRVATLERCGALRTPERLRLAASAALAARTLGMTAIEKAYQWSRAAVVADSADRRNWRVMAQAWDQLQVVQQKRQWFATVVSCVSPVIGRCTLAPLDTTRVTEALRLEFGLPTLQQQRRSVDSLNRVRGLP